MANKDPAVLFYTADFLSGAALMNMKERGQYITLLCLQRERGHMSMAEITKAVGKVSEEVIGKFVDDGEGRFYNLRMEEEIKKRIAHSQKQRENVNKRWNKQNTDAGTPVGNTTVLPLGNGNGNKKENIFIFEEELKDEVGTTPHVVPPKARAAVLADYLNRINPSASPMSLEELGNYADSLGEAVCKRAFDIALDSKKTTWPYIRAILRRCESQGVKCLADWDALEEQRKKPAAKEDKAPNKADDEVKRRIAEMHQKYAKK